MSPEEWLPLEVLEIRAEVKRRRDAESRWYRNMHVAAAVGPLIAIGAHAMISHTSSLGTAGADTGSSPAGGGAVTIHTPEPTGNTHPVLGTGAPWDETPETSASIWMEGASSGDDVRGDDDELLRSETFAADTSTTAQPDPRDTEVKQRTT